MILGAPKELMEVRGSPLALGKGDAPRDLQI
jgi:hypothetical protein